MLALNNYENFLKDLHSNIGNSLKNADRVSNQEAINNVILSEQNAILKQIGLTLALIADELHELNNKPADSSEEG